MKVVIIVLALFYFAGAQAEAGEPVLSEEPITIISDRLDAYEDAMKIVFSGNVVVSQKDITLKSDILNVFYSREKAGTNMAIQKNPIGEGAVKKIEAQGSVHVSQDGNTVTGDHALYFNDEQRIEVEGNVIMQDGKNIIEGEKAIFFIKENRGIVESSPLKRVKALIYPDSKHKKQ